MARTWMSLFISSTSGSKKTPDAKWLLLFNKEGEAVFLSKKSSTGFVDKIVDNVDNYVDEKSYLVDK